MNTFDSLVNVIHWQDWQDRTKDFSEKEGAEKVRLPLNIRDLKTHSVIKESSTETSRTTVGEIYLFSLSTTPPKTILPCDLSNKPAIRDEACGVMIRL
jgi:hypothetical protein